MVEMDINLDDKFIVVYIFIFVNDLIIILYDIIMGMVIELVSMFEIVK